MQEGSGGPVEVLAFETKPDSGHAEAEGHRVAREGSCGAGRDRAAQRLADVERYAQLDFLA